MDEGGNTKDDLGLPKGTDDADKLADQIKQDFDDGKELVVTVVKVIVTAGHQTLCSCVTMRCMQLAAACHSLVKAMSRTYCLQAMGEEMVSAVKTAAGSS